MSLKCRDGDLFSFAIHRLLMFDKEKECQPPPHDDEFDCLSSALSEIDAGLSRLFAIR